MTTPKSIVESLLFIANRPLTKEEVSKISGRTKGEIERVLLELVEEYNKKQGGIKIINNGEEFQMVTDAQSAPFIQEFLKQEVNKELTPASLETLSIIAYRGPITKSDLEQIRGVNCSIILRNLLIKGLIVEQSLSASDNAAQVEDGGKESMGPEIKEEIYSVSLDFIRHLGINSLQELPDYKELNRDIPLLSLTE